MNIWCVTNWPYHEHREMPKRCPWVKAKVDFQGADWCKLARHRHAAAALATWEVVRGLALLSPFRGLLLSNGHRTAPLTLESISEQSHVRKAIIVKGMSVLCDDLGWVSIHSYNGDAAALSKSFWGQVYAAEEDMTRCAAPDARKQRGNSAETSRRIPKRPLSHHITSQSQDSDSDHCEGKLCETWGNGNWGVIKNAMPTEWRFYLEKCLPQLREWSPAIVLGHIIDLKRARKKAPDMAAVERRLFWRLKHADPSAGHYDEAKRLLRMHG